MRFNYHITAVRIPELPGPVSFSPHPPPLSLPPPHPYGLLYRQTEGKGKGWSEVGRFSEVEAELREGDDAVLERIASALRAAFDAGRLPESYHLIHPDGVAMNNHHTFWETLADGTRVFARNSTDGG